VDVRGKLGGIHYNSCVDVEGKQLVFRNWLLLSCVDARDVNRFSEEI